MKIFDKLKEITFEEFKEISFNDRKWCIVEKDNYNIGDIIRLICSNTNQQHFLDVEVTDIKESTENVGRIVLGIERSIKGISIIDGPNIIEDINNTEEDEVIEITLNIK